MFCPKCQTQNPEEAKFCLSCGSLLEVQSSPTQVSSPVSPAQTVSKPWWEILWKVLIVVLFLGPLGLLLAYLLWAKTNFSKTIKWVITLIIFLLSCLLNVWLVQATNKDRAKKEIPKQEQKKSPSSLPSTQKPELLPTPTPLPPETLIQTAGTEFPGVKAELTSVNRNGNIVTVRFTLRASTNKNELEKSSKYDWAYTPIYGELVNCHPAPGFTESCDKGPYSLASAYIVDETNQMKYEVMKGADGKPLASETPAKDLRTGQAISLYAQFMAPPETTTTVTINFPKIQPFTGITLE